MSDEAVDVDKKFEEAAQASQSIADRANAELNALSPEERKAATEAVVKNAEATKEPEKIDPDAPAPELHPDQILSEAETNAQRDEIVAKYPKFWQRIMREFQLQLNQILSNAVQPLNQQIVDRNTMLAGVVGMNGWKPVVLDRLVMSDVTAKVGSLSFTKHPRTGEQVIAFIQLDDPKPILVTGDQRVLKMPAPGPNKKGPFRR